MSAAPPYGWVSCDVIARNVAICLRERLRAAIPGRTPAQTRDAVAAALSELGEVSHDPHAPARVSFHDQPVTNAA